MTTTTTNIRRSNLRMLIREAGGHTLLGKRLKMSRNELRQLASKRNECSIGSWLARDIENKLGIETGWLDMPHDALPDNALSIARKWMMLPEGIQDQIKDYMTLQLYSLRHDINSTEKDEITDFDKIQSRQSSWK